MSTREIREHIARRAFTPNGTIARTTVLSSPECRDSTPDRFSVSRESTGRATAGVCLSTVVVDRRGVRALPLLAGSGRRCGQWSRGGLRARSRVAPAANTPTIFFGRPC